MASDLAAMLYAGTKSGRSALGLGHWIAGQLPQSEQQTYVEPFAGMLGVLLARPRSQLEIVNDLDERVVIGGD